MAKNIILMVFTN